MGATRQKVLIREALVRDLLETIRANPNYVIDELGTRLLAELDEMPHGVERGQAFYPLLWDLTRSGVYVA